MSSPRSNKPEPTEPFTLGAGLDVLPLKTPTIPPATRTNCVIAGNEGAVIVVDPGSPWRDEQERLETHLGSRKVEAILVTHHHHDHVGGIEALKKETNAPVLAHPQTARLLESGPTAGLVTETVRDGFAIQVPGWPQRILRAVYTPGHTPGHLCWKDEGTESTRVLLGGDMVAGTGTVVVAPPEGDMGHYLESLTRMEAEVTQVILPAHGPVIDDGPALLATYREHRLWRENKVAKSLGPEPLEIMEITRRVYTDVPEALHPLASHSCLAHLQRLVNLGRVILAEDGASQRWTLPTAQDDHGESG